ncbi:MAG: hypothetical protein C4318_05450 [Acidimicrobiia bacterium]
MAAGSALLRCSMRHWLAVLVFAVASASVLSACDFVSPVVATVNASPITREWLDSVSDAFEGDKALQALIDVGPAVVVSSAEEERSQSGLRGRDLRLALLSRRMNLEVVDTMLGRMNLDPSAWRKQAAAEVERQTQAKTWASESQRRAVLEFASKWRGDRALLIEAIMPSQPSETSLELLFQRYPGFGAKLCFSVIKVENDDESRKVAERLNAGESFSAVAADLSVDLATKPRRGDVGCVTLLQAFQRLQDPVPFAVALSLRPGQARGPIEGATGARWFVRHSDSGSTGLDFDSARPQLLEQYGQARLQVVSDQFVEVALSLDVRIACPEGRWNPEQLAIEACDSSSGGAHPPLPQPEQ